MACYHPIPAYQEGPGAKVRLGPPLGTENLALPCGKCIGCRTMRATQWAHRCQHEAALWENNIFVTLTYADDKLPDQGHLSPTDLQHFFKRLRRDAGRTNSTVRSDHRANIRYFACGEYGERNGRPHYHAILFNCDFGDREQTSTRGEFKLFRSDTLAKLWPNGHHEIGSVTVRSANYIAQYSLKKQGGPDCDADGVYRPSPFLRMSLKPAIGANWVDRFETDLTFGYLEENATKHAIPRYYKERLKTRNEQLHAEMLMRLQQNMINHPTDRNTEPRIRARERIHIQRKRDTERELR